MIAVLCPHLGPPGLELRDDSVVVPGVPGHQVGSLQDQADDRSVGLELHVLTGVVPAWGKVQGRVGKLSGDAASEHYRTRDVGHM